MSQRGESNHREHTVHCVECFLSIVLLAVALMSTSCSPPKPKYQEIFGPDVEVDFLVFFNTGTSNLAISDFWDHVLMKPEKGGYQFREGIYSVGRSVFIEGHESVSVQLYREITASQREEIKSRILSSPIVYKVFENVIPSDIKNID